jgi:RNA polymerase sigma factor (sigma-70 family)
MARAFAGDVGLRLGRLFRAGSAVGLTDRELLERFNQRRDESAEAAFETILARHGGLVLTVCRQVLGDAHAAEDAFQATFLVLVRRARFLRIGERGSLGPWLYGVAYRIALKARQGSARRRARERRAAAPAVGGPAGALAQGELQALLHAEVNRLPAKFRAPVVLCYFEGRTHDEAAAALGWLVGTVRGRLARARDLLRARLTRRGLAPAAWIGASLLEPAAWLAPPARLLEATITAAIGGMPSGAASAMANLLLRGLLVARLKMTAVVLSLSLIVAGISLAVHGTPAPQVRTPTETAATVATAPKPSTSLDRQGDPLPAYARARMGTIRFHGGSRVNQIFFTPDAKSQVTVDNIPIVRVWEATTGQAVREIGSPPSGPPQVTPSRRIALSPDGKTLATVDHPSRLRLWDVATGRERRRWREPKHCEYRGPIFAPNGRTLAVSVTRYEQASDTSETFIELFDSASPTEHRRRIPGGWVRLWDLKFSPDGKFVATATRDTHHMRGQTLIGPQTGSTRLWDVAAGRELRRFPVERLDVFSLAFSADGTVLAATVSDGTIRFYNLATGHERTPRLGPGWANAFSPDGTVVAAAVRDGKIRFFNLASGHERMPRLGPAPDGFADIPAPGETGPALAKLPGGDVKSARSRPTELGSLAFSPDGTILAAATRRGELSLATVELWDVARGRELHRIPTHQQSVGSLSFAPDGKTLASTGDGPVVRLWDVATAREVFSQSGHWSPSIPLSCRQPTARSSPAAPMARFGTGTRRPAENWTSSPSAVGPSTRFASHRTARAYSWSARGRPGGLACGAW